MAQTHLQPKAWTFMAYMAGDNNLDPDGVQDLTEMKKVGSTKDVNLIAQFDRASGHAAKRYYLRKGGQIANDAVASLGKVNTGDPKRLLDFIKWGVKNYPANRYVLVLWNHGQGWDDTDIFANERNRRFRRLASGPIRHSFFHKPIRRALARAIREPQMRAILIDDSAKDFLDNLEMKKVLAAALRQGLGDAATAQHILVARTQAQCYEVQDNIDLVDFCSLLSQAAAGSDVARCCQEVIQITQTGYVLNQGYKGSDLQNSHGVAIYFPTLAVSPVYAGLDFSQKTGWDAFLNTYATSVRSR